MTETVAFWVLGPAAVAAGLAVFRVGSMARATYALLTSFLAVAALLAALELHYLAFVTVLMMTVEMAVMGVFMIMFMMNPAGLMPMAMVHNKRGSLVLSVGAFAVVTAGVWAVDWPQRRGDPPADATRSLGEAIMGPHMVVMAVVAAGLFTAMVAAIVLATDRGRYDRLGPDLRRRRADDPVRGSVGR